MSSNHTVIVLKETAIQSLVSDAITLATFAAMIGLGVFLQSDAMQWVGGLVFFLWALGRTKSKRFTIAQARKFLDELETTHDHP